jgi:tRNA nucleotidyltransferase (CCA-adding enzyme)
VGGSVRDLLIGRAPGDFDVATSALPEATMRHLRQALRDSNRASARHRDGAGRAPPEQRHVEVTTFRGEGAYLDGRRPSSVTFSATLDEDLARRDFTMNAIAFDPNSGVIIDPFDGQGDIARKLVRAVGDPFLRFTEDGLRPMRAVRQAAQLGFSLDPDTQAAIPRTFASFRKVSAERIRDELRKLLLAPKPSLGLEYMRVTGLLAEVLPEMLPTIGCVQNRFHKHDVYQHILATWTRRFRISSCGWPRFCTTWASPRPKPRAKTRPASTPSFATSRSGSTWPRPFAPASNCPPAERSTICALVGGHMFFYTPDWTDGTVRRFVKRVGPELVPALFALREADVASRGQGEDPQGETRVLRDRIAKVAAEDAALRVTDLAIDGKDVMRVLGIPPSRRIGEILEQLLEKVLDDPKLNERDTLEALLRALRRHRARMAGSDPEPHPFRFARRLNSTWPT